MIIQLQHHASNKHLSTSRQLATGHVGNRVLVHDHAGESGLFRVKPRLRVHNEGEKVHSGDPVVLEEVTTGQRLMLGSPPPSGVHEVVSAPEMTVGAVALPSSFKMVRGARNARALA